MCGGMCAGWDCDGGGGPQDDREQGCTGGVTGIYVGDPDSVLALFAEPDSAPRGPAVRRVGPCAARVAAHPTLADDHMVIVGRSSGRAWATGTKFHVSVVHIWLMRDGQTVSFEVYRARRAHAADAARGRS
jgi:hypothetical protein